MYGGGLTPSSCPRLHGVLGPGYGGGGDVGGGGWSHRCRYISCSNTRALDALGMLCTASPVGRGPSTLPRLSRGGTWLGECPHVEWALIARWWPVPGHLPVAFMSPPRRMAWPCCAWSPLCRVSFDWCGGANRARDSSGWSGQVGLVGCSCFSTISGRWSWIRCRSFLNL